MSPAPATDHDSPHWFKARVTSLVRRITPNCREVTRLSSEQRDHPLPVGTRTRVGLHRLFCKYCARYAAQLEVLHEAVRRLPAQQEEMAAPALGADARARLKRALQPQPPDE